MITLLFNRYVIGAALAAFLLGGAYLKGRSDCSAKYEYAALQSERDSLRKLIEADHAAREADAKRLAENESLLRDLQEKAEEDAKNLQDGGSICFAPGDVDSLRQHFHTSH